jgi:hypothetical protein
VLQYNRQCCTVTVLCCVQYCILILTGFFFPGSGSAYPPAPPHSGLTTAPFPDDGKSAIAAPSDPDSVNRNSVYSNTVTYLWA